MIWIIWFDSKHNRYVITHQENIESALTTDHLPSTSNKQMLFLYFLRVSKSHSLKTTTCAHPPKQKALKASKLHRMWTGYCTVSTCINAQCPLALFLALDVKSRSLQNLCELGQLLLGLCLTFWMTLQPRLYEAASLRSVAFFLKKVLLEAGGMNVGMEFLHIVRISDPDWVLGNLLIAALTCGQPRVNLKWYLDNACVRVALCAAPS